MISATFKVTRSAISLQTPCSLCHSVKEIGIESQVPSIVMAGLVMLNNFNLVLPGHYVCDDCMSLKYSPIETEDKQDAGND